MHVALARCTVLIPVGTFSSVDVVIGGWENILEWTKTGDTVPYLNFNDYLHYYA